MAMEKFDPDKMNEIVKNLGPDYLALQLEQVVAFCWWSIPKERRSHEELAKEFRRHVDDALASFPEKLKSLNLE